MSPIASSMDDACPGKRLNGCQWISIGVSSPLFEMLSIMILAVVEKSYSRGPGESFSSLYNV